MCHAFERLRVIREYRSPRTIRSFTKVFIFLMPILLSPYYVHMGIKSGNTWSPYYIAVLTSFIFGTLQGVQDVLDDPFDEISADDINLGQVRSVFKRIQWTLSKSGFKSWTSLNFQVYALPFIHCFFFIYARKFLVRLHGKITRQRKSTLRRTPFSPFRALR